MLKRSIFIILISLISLNIPINTTTQYTSEDVLVLSSEERDYLKIKEAVFIKMGPDFACSFNGRYPHFCEKGLKELRKYIDKIPSTMLKSNPPQITITVGTHNVHLHSHLVEMLMWMRDEVPATILK